MRIKVVPDKECPFGAFRKGRNICAGNVDAGRDSRGGDSGGPLECFVGEGIKYLCGVVSRGKGPPECGDFNGVYVKTTTGDMIKWLKSNANAKVFSDKDRKPRNLKEGEYNLEI